MATPRTVAFHTLGCKLNFSETSAIRRSFENKGYTTIPFEQGADIYVLNTCSVTDFADRKCRYEVRRALKYSPQARIVVVGCYAQLKPAEIASIPGVDLVLGAGEKFRILDFIDGLSNTGDKGMVVAGDIREVNTFVDAFSFGDRTRSFLKVQDGCNYKCSFCTIPQARGASRSDTVENVLRNARQIASQGVKEIVLTGVNLGDFGQGTEVIEGRSAAREALFIDLIRALDQVEDVERFRISSIEPNLLTREIISFVSSSKRFVPHFHIPLQSGSDDVLKRMRRRYGTALYEERIQWIRECLPDACIGVDVIVGFPGETEKDFMDTVAFLTALDVSYLHVFTYSERANTPASEMPDVVPMEIRRCRNDILRQLSHKKRTAFMRRYLGTVRPVLFEAGSAPGEMSGYTDNYIKVTLPADENCIHSIRYVELETMDRTSEAVYGKILFAEV